ncbi:hypothetical protein Taro_034863 [Colocasia esculenta]|uniref:Uncharacterized protein n=1 Tax=Colocasia esculenta TaxID=4460 RepID=A0A843WBC9_COLES|nr:hypothetical protein [Colocasia esculenta]
MHLPRWVLTSLSVSSRCPESYAVPQRCRSTHSPPSSPLSKYPPICACVRVMTITDGYRLQREASRWHDLMEESEAEATLLPLSKFFAHWSLFAILVHATSDCSTTCALPSHFNPCFPTFSALEMSAFLSLDKRRPSVHLLHGSVFCAEQKGGGRWRRCTLLRGQKTLSHEELKGAANESVAFDAAELGGSSRSSPSLPWGTGKRYAYRPPPNKTVQI